MPLPLYGLLNLLVWRHHLGAPERHEGSGQEDEERRSRHRRISIHRRFGVRRRQVHGTHEVDNARASLPEHTECLYSPLIIQRSRTYLQKLLRCPRRILSPKQICYMPMANLYPPDTVLD